MADHGEAQPSAKRIAMALLRVWYAPLLLAGRACRRAAPMIAADTARWTEVTDTRPASTLALLAKYPEFRTLYQYRIARSGGLFAVVAGILKVLYPGERTLHLACGDIGPGLFIQHGFATVIAARRVGANCWVNQQVTIGFDRPESRPTLGDNVSVHAGAKVLGDITLHDGARVGANAVVLEDVPAGFTAVGIPARLLPPKSQRP